LTAYKHEERTSEVRNSDLRLDKIEKWDTRKIELQGKNLDHHLYQAQSIRKHINIWTHPQTKAKSFASKGRVGRIPEL